MKMLKKIVVLFLICIIGVSTTFASTDGLATFIEKMQGEIEYIFGELYPKFCDNVANLQDYSDGKLGIGRAYFGVDNKKLIIGCSPVVFMSYYAQWELDKREYDIVGFGSTVDSQIYSMLSSIPKKYEKIVIWCAANDILGAINNHTTLDDTYYDMLSCLLSEGKRHLTGSPASKIVFVNVKDIVKNVDDFPQNKIDIYNNMAHDINSFVKNNGIESVDITTPTDCHNSEWYIHYNNPIAIGEIMTVIDGG